MSSLSCITYSASGNISPARFVQAISGSDFKVGAITATTQRPIGVSHFSTQEAPGTAADSGYVATDGKELRVYNPGEEALLEIGGVVSAGDFLIPDSVGRGVAASITATSHTDIGAYALQSSATTGAKLRVQVRQIPGVMSN